MSPPALRLMRPGQRIVSERQWGDHFYMSASGDSEMGHGRASVYARTTVHWHASGGDHDGGGGVIIATVR